MRTAANTTTPAARDQSKKTEETNNYEISRVTKTEVTEAGRVNRPLIKALGGFGVLPQIFPSDGTVSAVTLCLLREGLAGSSADAETASLFGDGVVAGFAGSNLDDAKRRFEAHVTTLARVSRWPRDSA